jgi:acetyl/propionyl-CoA carboxylase alpha subunit
MLFDATVAGTTTRVEVREKNGVYRVTVGEETLEIDALRIGPSELSVLIDGVSHDVALENAGGTPGSPTSMIGVIIRGDRFDVELKDATKGVAASKPAAAGPLKLNAPMPGKIVKVLVNVGDTVEAGKGVLVMEAMKMENELKASRGGIVQDLRVKEGQAVETGALLMVIG